MTTTTAPAFTSSISTFGIKDHAGAVAYFNARRAELLEAAEVSSALAETVLGHGDNAAARDLMASVRAMLAEVAKIDSARK